MTNQTETLMYHTIPVEFATVLTLFFWGGQKGGSGFTTTFLRSKNWHQFFQGCFSP